MTFNFIDKRSSTNEEEGVVLSIIQSVNTVAQTQKEALIHLLEQEEIEYTSNDNEDLFYLKQANSTILKGIEQNFDIIQGITSSRALTIRPGVYGDLRMEYGFEVEIIENLPTVGVIDTGVNVIEPFKGLIVDGGINITGETHADYSGHGTLVAGLTIFGESLSASVQESYKAKCRVLPIKVLHEPNGTINFPLLLKAIRTANEENSVRIFNMSLVFGQAKSYNEVFSDFAFELDKLSFELDILIFISVGNFDSVALKDLITTNSHDDHNYPNFFYSLDSSSPVHDCKNTNICTPSESLNNITVGALAGNTEEGDNSDISPSSLYPAYYTRKFHFDYEQKVNTVKVSKNQKNKHLNKPDFVYDGGDLLNDEFGIEVLAKAGVFYLRTAGTSLSTPLIASMAAEIQYAYPDINTQSIKALLINNASYYKPKQLPLFQNKGTLLKKIIGFGIPKKNNLLESDDNSITVVLEDQISILEMLSIPIYLPPYLKESKNKLIFNISMAYSFFPDKGNHLGYLPLHMSFNLVQNLPIKNIANNRGSDTVAKKGFSWSEDDFGKENILFSNAQSKEYRLQPTDLIKLDGELAIAVRCLSKDNIDDTLKTQLKNTKHSFSLVIRITEEVKHVTEHSLYTEMIASNNLSVIGDVIVEGGLDLDAEI